MNTPFRYIFSIAFLLFCSQAQAADTLKVMQYNLLKYGDAGCQSLTVKNTYLKTILQYELPDILGVNEMGDDEAYAEAILNSSLNTNGITHYKRAGYTNKAKSDIVNMLFYNGSKLELKSQEVINGNIRDINVYHLYYKSTSLPVLKDTVFMHIIVAHLKAGNTSSDASSRGVMAEEIAKYLRARNYKENVWVMGDFNVYTSTEVAFQKFVNPSDTSLRMNDPVNQLGDWSSNSSFARWHSQSTHVSTENCATGGGLDDRFDFILLSNNMMRSNGGMQYVNGSFHYLGQDGKRYDKDLLANNNTTLPSGVLSSLYGMSDHLPAVLRLSISQTPAGIAAQNEMPVFFHTGANPFTREAVFYSEYNNRFTASLTDLYGRQVSEISATGSGRFYFDTYGLSQGLYYLNIRTGDGWSHSFKLIKTQE